MTQPTLAPDATAGGRSDPFTVLKRRAWRFAVATAAALAVVVGGTWIYVRYATPPLLVGAVVTPPIEAFDFSLADQQGRMVTFSQFRGKAVALTFIYTHCPDVCPLIADNMGQAYRQLGTVAQGVALVAVSTDPNGDTPKAIREFLKAHRIEGVLTYLHGSFAQLRPVWAHYFVGTDAREINPRAGAASTPGPTQVGHTSIVYVIDPQGQIRDFLPGNFDPNDLVTNLRLLAPRVR